MKLLKKIRLTFAFLFGLALFMNFSVDLNLSQDEKTQGFQVSIGGTPAFAQMHPDCGLRAIYLCGYRYGKKEFPVYHDGWIGIQ
ncbi:hypothetical protein [Algoriphagus confluentis]|uniref:Uncharacterized protein n=1 Tax=Algoriphagus confluentis TaxID=1697556 RepID=A0ABQ6PK79_9BACT|nr:hypothetical protein Aconfl_08160 [Algoriphagus confluentis]